MKLIIQSVREAQVEVYKDEEYSELEKEKKSESEFWSISV